MLFHAKFSLYIYIKYIGFGLVGFNSMSTIIGLFNAKYSLYIYIRYISFTLVGFHSILTLYT